MDVIIIIFVILAIVLCFTFAKPIYDRSSKSRDEQSFNEILHSLKELYEACVFIRTREYGLYESQNTSVAFSDVHKHQALAVSSVLSMTTLMEKN